VAVETLSPDGSGRATVLSMTARVNPTTTRNVWRLRWCPDGVHIAYECFLFDHSGGPDPLDHVYRVAVNGSGNTDLTPGGVSGLALNDWRE
jgi:hypothetical protein